MDSASALIFSVAAGDLALGKKASGRGAFVSSFLFHFSVLVNAPNAL